MLMLLETKAKRTDHSYFGYDVTHILIEKLGLERVLKII